VIGAIVDTSVFIAQEGGRPLPELPEVPLAVSVITIGELHAGALATDDVTLRAARLATLRSAASMAPIPIDDDVAHSWGLLRVQLRDAGTRMNINDSWIAATALAHGLAVVTQDADFDVVPELTVHRV
jgi:predicted nucleic acid-binding protein